MEGVPQEPVILLGWVNMKLRDYGQNLNELCHSMDIDRSELESRLETIGYHYEEAGNQFVSI